MERYKKDYKVYYDGIINKVNKGKKPKRNYKNTSEDIYPRTNLSNRPYYYNNKIATKSSNQSMKVGYINRFIIRLILTFIIFLGAFSLKILDNKEARILYNKGKDIVNKSYGFEKIENIENALEYLNIDYKEFFASIEEKYSEIIKN